MGKAHERAFIVINRRMRATNDVCGPTRTTAMGGTKYFVTFIDDFSRKVWLYVLKPKDECFIRFKEFKALVETQSEYKIKTFRSDNGGEFMSKAFIKFLVDHGIAKETSTPYWPQQNRVAERANRTIIEMARSMIHAQKLEKSFWAESVVNAVYTRNRCPTRALERMTPEEAWSGRKASVAHIRVFGCLAYAMVPDEKRSKLDAKGTKCLFLGYCEGTKAYMLICLQTKIIIKCRDVEFLEDSTSMGDDSEIRPSGINEEPNKVIVDESPKLEHNDECKERVGDNMAQNGGPTLSDGTDERVGEVPQPHAMSDGNGTNICEAMRTLSDGNEESFSKDGRYLLRERRPRGEWWKNHILPRHKQERANVALVDNLLNPRMRVSGRSQCKRSTTRSWQMERGS